MKQLAKNGINNHINKIKNTKIKIIIQNIRKIINESFPNVQELISWRASCYKTNKYILAVHYTKDYARLDFFNGTKLKDPHNLLQGVGNKLRHIKINSIKGINKNKKQLIKWIEEPIVSIKKIKKE